MNKFLELVKTLNNIQETEELQEYGPGRLSLFNINTDGKDFTFNIDKILLMDSDEFYYNKDNYLDLILEELESYIESFEHAKKALLFYIG